MIILVHQIHLIDIDSQREGINEVHCQPHHMVSSPIAHPFVLNDVLDCFSIEDFQFFSIFEDVHKRYFFVEDVCLGTFAVVMPVHDVEPCLSQEVYRVLYLLDLGSVNKTHLAVLLDLFY